MTALTQLMLISLCVCAHAAPLGDLHRHRSDNGVYASNYANDYQPLVYAAIPLHRPMPVLHVLSRRPLSRERTVAPSVHHPVYARPPYVDNNYAPSSHNEYEYTSYGYADTHNYREPPSYASSYEQQYAGPEVSASQDEITILYARPNPLGGFSYRRQPSKTAPKRAPVSTTESPIIIRVHRYKVVKDV